MSDALPHADQLGEIAERNAACTACGLAETRRSVVFGEGNPDAPLVFVGEGPGDREDATGRPFVGRAGVLLDECMRECRITRAHVYICNVVKCRACIVEEGRARNRQPTLMEIDLCAPWLDEQLRVLKPLVIVCLGSPSANKLIHKGFQITRERGQWFTSCVYARYATAALHPAYILRQAGDAFDQARASLVADIESARKKVIEARKETPSTLF
jgi:uracil-DNA glycosylase